jgi:hypothetical protein
MAVVRVQSAEMVAVEAPRNVTTRVDGQVNGKMISVVVEQSVVSVVRGVANTSSESGGHWIEIGLTVGGKVMVVTVGPVAVTTVANGVRNTPETVPLVSPGPSLPQLSGGPRVTSGHGGTRTVRVVVPPSPSGRDTTTGERSTLGSTVMGVVVVWPLVMLTLEYCIASAVTGSS